MELPFGTLAHMLKVPEGQTVTIDSDILSARDADTDVLKLTYIVNRNPRIGKILKNGLPAERFTQRDVLRGLVVYKHDSGEIGREKVRDSFSLGLTDRSDQLVVD